MALYKHVAPARNMFTDGWTGGPIIDMGVHNGWQFFGMDPEVAAQVDALTPEEMFGPASAEDVAALQALPFGWAPDQKTILGLP